MEQTFPSPQLEATPEEPTVEEPVTTTPNFGYSKLLIPILVVAILTLAGVIIFLVKRSATISLPSQPTSEIIVAATPSPTTVAIDTSNWKTYTDATIGLSFKYPDSVLINDESSQDTTLSLQVAAEKLSDIPEELPSFMGRNDAIKQRALLAEGGPNLVDLGPLNGSIVTTYAQFEVCSVMFVRRLTFYPTDYRVMMTMTAPESKMMAAMPDFFQVDPANCGEMMVWDRDQLGNFETTLANHQGAGIAQEWYDTFNAIVGTIQLTTPVVSSPSLRPSPAQVSQSSYKNDTYGFELTYAAPYRLQTSKEDLYGYPHGVALLYSGGQAYDIVIEVWDTEAAYKTEYGPRVSDLTVLQNKGKYITILDNTGSSENKQIIESVKLTP